MTRRDVVWLDPSIDTHNHGDQVIAAAVGAVFDELGVEPAIRTSTRRVIPWTAVEDLHEPLFIIGGTNLLNSDQPFRRWWRLNPRDVHRINQSTVLLGVGWWQYQRDPNRYTSWLYQKALSSTIPNSVRDNYTKAKVGALGIPAINTGCPTTWSLSAMPEERQTRGTRVITTITDYAQSPEQDAQLLSLLQELYREVLIWPQGRDDERYIRSLGSSASVLPEDLAIFDAEVSDPDTDYVGTRLHAGIRALQRGARTTIVEVDNRAKEMGADLNLPVIPRELSEQSRAFLADDRQVRLTIPHREIADWKESLLRRIEHS